jgi:hypothetical protein
MIRLILGLLIAGGAVDADPHTPIGTILAIALIGLVIAATGVRAAINRKD